MRGGIAIGAAALLGLLASLAPASGARAADVRRLEAVGEAPVSRDAPRRGGPRQAAVDRALQDAVRRVALDEPAATGELESAGGEMAETLAEILGDDPLVYATRFRILEDRGERKALFAGEGVDSEYVVVVEAFIDAERVRERLAQSGLLQQPSGDGPLSRIRLVVEGLESHAAYASLRAALVDGAGARSALPVEMERGRAVLEVQADRDPDALVAALLRSAPPGLRVTPIDTGRDHFTVRVDWVGGEPAPAQRPRN